MAAGAPNVFTIPASVPFLPALIAALTEGRLVAGFPGDGDPLALASATIYLPTRRACRLIRDVFLDQTGTDAAILPRIVAIGDIDEDELAFAESASGPLAERSLDLPPAIEGLERKLLLSQLILKWASLPGVRGAGGAALVAGNPASALALADELARLIDDMATRKVTWDKLDVLVPEAHDKYWQITLEFLKIARDQWPALLQERGRIEAAMRRDFLIAAEMERLRGMGGGPVIAAGSTASMPSTAMLLEAVARLPNGAVVLPGLDTDLDEESWRLIVQDSVYGHPQFGMASFLDRLGIARKAVVALAQPSPGGRDILASEALRPAGATQRWQTRLQERPFAEKAEAALAGISAIEAGHPEDEALAIAAVLREAVDDGTPASKERTAALVTPDRGLARRVLAALERWAVPVDDSGGGPLSETPAGIFAQLAADTALGGVTPVDLLSLLKHPLCRIENKEAGTQILERAVLRGPRPRARSAGLIHALETLRQNFSGLHRNDPRAALGPAELGEAQDFALRIAAALEPLETLASQDVSLRDMSGRHRQAIEMLTGGASAMSAGADGAALALLFDELAESASAAQLPIAVPDYPDLFRQIAAGRIVRRPGAPGARVRIYGPLEARLQIADRVVLGGLVEGVWPPETRTDPWLSRPMRSDLGLDLPERRIGLSAHDFAQALGAPEVFVTYPAKLEGAPAVPSRFLQRLAVVAGDKRWKEAVARGTQYLHWAHALDRPEGNPEPCARPAPKPPLEARPKRLTVTEIEHWLRDPYTIYAKHILRLVPLDPVDTPPGARDRGTFIHAAIGEFTAKFKDQLPPDPAAALVEIGKKAFASLEDYPEARAFWWPRFLRVAKWFAEWETGRRGRITALHAEIAGHIDVTPGFRLAARADRIERNADGSYCVIDYKTGQPPGNREVAAGLAPQLTLEAAIARQGGFEGIPAGVSISELLYVKLGGGNPAGEPSPKKFENSTPDREADKALARLREVVTKFDLPETPYQSFSRPKWAGRKYSDYDHLARVREWSMSGGEEPEGET